MGKLRASLGASDENEGQGRGKNNNKDNNIDNSFYTDSLFKKKDFEEDSNDFVDEDKLSIGIKILIALVIIVFVVGLILFIKSVI